MVLRSALGAGVWTEIPAVSDLETPRAPNSSGLTEWRRLDRRVIARTQPPGFRSWFLFGHRHQPLSSPPTDVLHSFLFEEPNETPLLDGTALDQCSVLEDESTELVAPEKYQDTLLFAACGCLWQQKTLFEGGLSAIRTLGGDFENFDFGEWLAVALFLFVAGFVVEFEDNLLVPPPLLENLGGYCGSGNKRGTDLCPDFALRNRGSSTSSGSRDILGLRVANEQYLVKNNIGALLQVEFFDFKLIAFGDFVLLSPCFNNCK